MDYLRGLGHLVRSPVILTSAGGIGGIVLASRMGLFSRKNHMPVEGRTILLTGASDGLGRSAARQLSEQGANLILVARNLARLQQAVTEAQASAKFPESQRFHYISADVSHAGYAVRVVREATAWNGGRAPDVVWCVAGSSTPMLWADSADALSTTRHMMDVNFWGAAEMAHAILRAWYEYDEGDNEPENTVNAAAADPSPSLASRASATPPEPRHLVFTCSVLAFYSIAGYATYTPAKCALRGLADTLCQETLLYTDHPVRVHLVAPGTILSPGFEREQLTKPDITLQLEKDDPQQTPEQVAAAAIRGLQRGRYIVTVNMLGQLLGWVSLNGSLRNNWVVDVVGSWLASLAFAFVVFFMRRDISAHGKKHGHPRTYHKRPGRA